MPSSLTSWPELNLSDWRETRDTLQLWSQIVGKVRLALEAPMNHWWQTALYVSARGLSTHAMPYGNDSLELELDFIDHVLRFRTSRGEDRAVALAPKTVAAFYSETLFVLRSLGLDIRIRPMPQEIPDPIPLDRDEKHRSYDPEFAWRHWRILVQADRILRVFRSRFVGKSSPVHFFWGSFDLAVTRFSGNRAPDRSGADAITREAYSHECMSCGFWPGDARFPQPAFYAYAAPEPAGLSSAKIEPPHAFYHSAGKFFVLPYNEVRDSADPDRMVLRFCQSVYEATANLGRWDRTALDRPVHVAKERKIA